MTKETEDNASSNDLGSLQTGDPWPEHYRGTKYHYDDAGHMWWLVPGMGTKINALRGHTDITADLVRLRPEGGSFRITETGHVIMRDLTTNPPGNPIYVTDYGQRPEFEYVNASGDGLQVRDLWPAFYDGAKYSFLGRKVWWNNPETGTKQFAREQLPLSVLRDLTYLKPNGGSFRITENGRVLTLIPPQPMPPRLQEQYDGLSNAQKNLIAVKVESTDMLPVYVGDYYDGFSLLPVRRLTDPLSSETETEIAEFLKKYGQGGPASKIADTVLPDFEDDRPEEPE